MFRNRAEKPVDIKPWFSESCASLILGLLNNNVCKNILFHIISQNKDLILMK